MTTRSTSARIAELEAALERARQRIAELETALRESATEEEGSVLSGWAEEVGLPVEEVDREDEEVVAFDDEGISPLGVGAPVEDVRSPQSDTFVATMPEEDGLDGAMSIGNTPFEIPVAEDGYPPEANSPASGEDAFATGWTGQMPVAPEGAGEEEEKDRDRPSEEMRHRAGDRDAEAETASGTDSTDQESGSSDGYRWPD